MLSAIKYFLIVILIGLLIYLVFFYYPSYLDRKIKDLQNAQMEIELKIQSIDSLLAKYQSISDSLKSVNDSLLQSRLAYKPIRIKHLTPNDLANATKDSLRYYLLKAINSN